MIFWRIVRRFYKEGFSGRLSEDSFRADCWPASNDARWANCSRWLVMRYAIMSDIDTPSSNANAWNFWCSIEVSPQITLRGYRRDTLSFKVRLRMPGLKRPMESLWLPYGLPALRLCFIISQYIPADPGRRWRTHCCGGYIMYSEHR